MTPLDSVLLVALLVAVWGVADRHREVRVARTALTDAKTAAQLLLNEVSKAHAVERERYREAMTAAEARHAEQLATLSRLAQYGQERPGPATAFHHPGTEETLQRLISEASIERGAQALKQRYQQQGLVLSDEEARTQAASMLALRPPVSVSDA